jgi:hypothetical protein
MEKTFKVGDIPYKIVGEDIWRLPFEKDHHYYNLKKLKPDENNKFRLNGRVYSMYQINAIFLKDK